VTADPIRPLLTTAAPFALGGGGGARAASAAWISGKKKHCAATAPKRFAFVGASGERR